MRILVDHSSGLSPFTRKHPVELKVGEGRHMQHLNMTLEEAAALRDDLLRVIDEIDRIREAKGNVEGGAS